MDDNQSRRERRLAEIERKLAVLSESEREIIVRYWGLHDGVPWEVERLAKHYGRTVEKMRAHAERLEQKVREGRDENHT